jgi:NAD(P)-dependent dehydrogenase (short-subunit alcohol dehydrogenase family)
VEKYGGKALIILCDVAYADQVEAAAEQTEKEFGPIDVWVNNVQTVYLHLLRRSPRKNLKEHYIFLFSYFLSALLFTKLPTSK